MNRGKYGRAASLAAALAAAMALAGCFGGGGSGAPSTTAGTLADPYVVPDRANSDTTGGIEDYFAQGGVWSIGFARTGFSTGAGAFLFDRGNLYYDTAAGDWILPTGSADYRMTADGGGRYVSSGCANAGDCITLYVHDADPIASQYGTFALAKADNGTGETAFMAGYGGLRTNGSLVPTRGTATYSGDFEGYGNQGASVYELTGAVDVSVDFAGAALTMDAAGAIAGHPGGADAFTITATAPITTSTYSTNSFYGTGVSGSITSSGTALASYSGSFWGAFFGPDASEAVGMVAIRDTSGSGDFITGGFWTQQTSYTP
ncbi:MAG: hypothetical protein OEZ03_06815 [Alphaproteobacteria bacterium]|nr:hypothetical protein [Alphaproteobacteria bacterium]